MIAHVGGVPVEEALLPLVGGGAGAGLVLARAWIVSVAGSARARLRREV